MIPRTIHFCWFSDDPYPQTVSECLASWRRFCPGYRIKRWHDVRSLIQDVPFALEAYERRQWAFVADYVRLLVLHREGGVYLDSDVRLFGPLDRLLADDFFIGSVIIPERDGAHSLVEPAFMGASGGNPILVELMETYSGRRFSQQPMPEVVTEVFERHGFARVDEEQLLEGSLRVYPSEVFTNRFNPRKDIVALHLITQSWVVEGGRVFRFCRRHHLMFLYRVYSPVRALFRRFRGS